MLRFLYVFYTNGYIPQRKYIDADTGDFNARLRVAVELIPHICEKNRPDTGPSSLGSACGLRGHLRNIRELEFHRVLAFHRGCADSRGNQPLSHLLFV